MFCRLFPTNESRMKIVILLAKELWTWNRTESEKEKCFLNISFLLFLTSKVTLQK